MEGDPARDHSTGLVVFGILEIMLGIIVFSLAMLLLIVVSSTGLGGMKPSHFWMAMGFLFYMTGWFIAMGMGSIKARRWARALMLMGSWVAVFFGTLVLSLVLYILPAVYNMLADSGLVPPAAAMGILYFSILVLVLLQLVVPLAAIVFYGLRGVQGTCERRNPAPCWTDRCPLPLLAMGFVSVLGSFSLLTGATTNYAVFVYGRVLMGWLGFLVVLSISVACGYIGWGAFTRKIHAWWAAYALVLLTSSSMMLTFAELDMDALHTLMGYSAEQVAQLRRVDFLNPSVLTFVTCVWGIMACVYLVWVRDCFLPQKDRVEVKSYQQRKAEEDAARPAVSQLPRMRLD